jgi:lambda family phage portal protein
MKIPFFSRFAKGGNQARADALNTGLRVEPQVSASGMPSARKRAFLPTIQGMFKASATDSKDNWSAIPISPDVFITLRQPVLVARSREQWSNNDYVKGFQREVRVNVVGPHGVVLQAKSTLANGSYDKNANDAIESAWKEWGMPGSADVTGKLSWRNLQALAIEHAARDGEFIFRKVYGADAGPMGFSLQILDPQRLSVRYENYKFGDSGNFIRQGIEFTKAGKPVAYHFASLDEWDAYYYAISGKGFVRIPAEEIIHGYIQEMAGQRRGLPWTSTSLFRLHHLQGFEDAAVQNARAGATQMGFIQYDDGFGPEVDEDIDVAQTIEAEPLSFHELPMGAKFVDFKPQYPNGEFATFSKSMLRGASTGMGVSYNDLANDLEGVNFSSIRQGALNVREYWKELQQWLIETLIHPVYIEWLRYMLLSGKIITKTGKPLSPMRFDTYKAVHWQGKRWAWIDPKSEVTAAVTAIRAGLTSPSAVIREQGKDPGTVYREIAEDIKEMKAAGIPEEIIQVMFGILPAPEPSPNHADESVAKEPVAQ